MPDFLIQVEEFMDSFPGLYKGNIISICDKNYSSQLSVLSSYLLEPQPITLPCTVEDSVNVRDEDGDDIRFSVEGKKVLIQERVSIGSSIRIRYTCSNI